MFNEEFEKRCQEGLLNEYDGPPHEAYCTLCGVPFWLYMELSGDDQDDSYYWVSYFLARK